MPTHYQAASDPDHFARRFGISFRPRPSMVVQPGDQGHFVRRPRADADSKDPIEVDCNLQKQ